ncbi:MAG: glycosyltransferase [Dehalococcoidia bacterium]|nr:glycosyltransferase [Dehalococcoidia bacterium]MDW8120289.1 glycosyltransferase [Chloroflexota bacterium]
MSILPHCRLYDGKQSTLERCAVSPEDKIAVVLAAYNEQANLALLLPRLCTVLEALGMPWEVVLVVDGNDGSKEWAERFAQGFPAGRVRVFWSPRRRGFGNALRQGFHLVSPDVTLVTTMDCDLNHRPEELPRFLEAYRQTGAQMVVGSRYMQGGRVEALPFWKRWASRLTNRALPRLAGLPLTDITSNYRLYCRALTDRLAQVSRANDFSVAAETILQAAQWGAHIVEVPIAFQRRHSGASKLPKLATTLGYLRLFAKHLWGRATAS